MSAKKLVRNGKCASRNSKPPWNREVLLPSPALQKLLAAVFDKCRDIDDPRLRTQLKEDFVFHMTDWLNDLQGLQVLYSRPDQADPESASTFLVGFLCHVIPHLKAAGCLLVGEVADPFEKSYTSRGQE